MNAVQWNVLADNKYLTYFIKIELHSTLKLYQTVVSFENSEAANFRLCWYLVLNIEVLVIFRWVSSPTSSFSLLEFPLYLWIRSIIRKACFLRFFHWFSLNEQGLFLDEDFVMDTDYKKKSVPNLFASAWNCFQGVNKWK